jgi:hypothetical protein
MTTKPRMYQEYLDEMYVPGVAIFIPFMIYKAIRALTSDCYKKCYQGGVLTGFSGSECQHNCKLKQYVMEYKELEKSKRKCGKDDSCKQKIERALGAKAEQIRKKYKKVMSYR